MPAFDPNDCGKECKTLSRTLYDGARMAQNLELSEVLMFVADLWNELESQQKIVHTVWGAEDDGFPGTLEDKLEAGNNITLAAKIPDGAVGKAAKELVVEVACNTAPDHTILGAEHTDAATATVTRGSLIYGDATEWSELVVGTASYVLTSDGTDVAWAKPTIWKVGADVGADLEFIDYLQVTGSDHWIITTITGTSPNAVVDVTHNTPNSSGTTTLTWTEQDGTVVTLIWDATGHITASKGASGAAAGLVLTNTRATTTYTILRGDDEIFADTDGGAFTATLPPGIDGKRYRVQNNGSSGNVVTLAADGTDKLFGTASGTEPIYDGEKLIVVYDATEGWA